MEKAQFGPLSMQITLDGTGMGALRFAPSNAQWDITNVSVKCSTNVLEATATVYKGQIGDLYRVSATYAGSTGDYDNMDAPLHLNDGECIYIVWTGGDVGCTATATVSGTQTVNNGGFRVH